MKKKYKIIDYRFIVSDCCKEIIRSDIHSPSFCPKCKGQCEEIYITKYKEIEIDFDEFKVFLLEEGHIEIEKNEEETRVCL